MRYQHNGHLQRFVQSANQFHNFRSGTAIEIPGGLICQKYAWLIDERARKGDALLLATRKFNRTMLNPSCKADSLQCVLRHCPTFRTFDFRETQGKLDIFQHRHTWNQIE